MHRLRFRSGLLLTVVLMTAGGYAHAAHAALTASCSPSPTTAAVGDTVTWTATVSGGNPPYSYSWSGTNSLSGTATSTSIAYSTSGTKTASVTVTDSGTVGGIQDFPGYQCTGSNPFPNYSVSDTEDGGTGGKLAFWTKYPFHDNTTPAPADVLANPQNYCSSGSEYHIPATQYNGCQPFGSGTCPFDYGASISGGTGMAPAPYQQYTSFDAAIWVGGTAPSTITVSCSPSVTVGSATKPDLTAGTITPTSAVAGTAVSLKSAVTNQGGSSTGTGFYTLFQKADSSSGTNSTDLGTYYLSTALAAGSSFNASYSYTFASTGTYYIRACADKSSASNTGVIAESNENNNCGAWTAVTVAASSNGPNLTAGNITPTSSSSFNVTLSSTVMNIGTQTTGAGFYTLFQSATNGNGANAADLGTYYRSTALGAAGNFNATFAYTFPANGTYYIRACADKKSAADTGQIAETNENDNCGNWTAVTIATPGADLTAGNTTLSDGTPSVGESITFKANATNIGGDTSGSFPVLFQVQDSSRNDVALTDSSYLAGLASLASAQASVPYTFTSSGTYYVRACANYNTSWVAITTETNYGNNCGNWRSVTVGSGNSGSFTCDVDNSSVPVGQSATYTAVGGNPNDNYSWTASDNWSGTKNATGPSLIRTFTATGQYGMQVTDKTGANQTAQCPVVTVGNACSAPSATISANPTRVRSGSTSTLTWSASGVSVSCTVTGPGVNKTDAANSCNVGNDSIQTPAITAQSVYTITCDGVQQGQVIVNVVPNFSEF